MTKPIPIIILVVIICLTTLAHKYINWQIVKGTVVTSTHIEHAHTVMGLDMPRKEKITVTEYEEQ